MPKFTNQFSDLLALVSQVKSCILLKFHFTPISLFSIRVLILIRESSKNVLDSNYLWLQIITSFNALKVLVTQIAHANSRVDYRHKCTRWRAQDQSIHLLLIPID